MYPAYPARAHEDDFRDVRRTASFISIIFTLTIVDSMLPTSDHEYNIDSYAYHLTIDRRQLMFQMCCSLAGGDVETGWSS